MVVVPVNVFAPPKITKPGLVARLLITKLFVLVLPAEAMIPSNSKAWPPAASMKAVPGMTPLPGPTPMLLVR